MGVVGWILIAKGALFLFGARHVLETLSTSHPVTFGYMTRGPLGARRYSGSIRIAGFTLALIGGLLVWFAR